MLFSLLVRPQLRDWKNINNSVRIIQNEVSYKDSAFLVSLSTNKPLAMASGVPGAQGDR